MLRAKTFHSNLLPGGEQQHWCLPLCCSIRSCAYSGYWLNVCPLVLPGLVALRWSQWVEKPPLLLRVRRWSPGFVPRWAAVQFYQRRWCNWTQPTAPRANVLKVVNWARRVARWLAESRASAESRSHLRERDTTCEIITTAAAAARPLHG